MINKARQYIEQSLAGAKSPAVLCSFGKESLVLLKLVRAVNPNIPIFWFGDRLSKFAESVIKDNDLCIYSYAPADRYLVPNADGYSLIDEYSFGETRVPLVSDLVVGEKCEVELLSTVRTPLFDWQYDLTLWGYRADDNHPLINTQFPQRFALGGTTMDSPLWSWTEADVYDALETLRIPYEPETNTIAVCEDCLREIDATVSSNSLTAFQERFRWGGH